MIGVIEEDKNNKEFTTGTAFKKLVLLVDDDLAWQGLLTDILTLNNEFEVVCVSSFSEAQRLIKLNNSSFHIVVVDVNLDDEDSENIDGFRLLEEMLRIKHPARAIILDHHLDAVDRLKRAYELRAADYFDKTPPNKPFNKHKFMDAVYKAVEQSDIVDVFVIMPFDPKYWNFYENTIKTTFEEMGLSCKRSDEIFHRGVIMKDILRSVRHAKFIVADLSGRNPNVLFEIGLSHAIQKPGILLSRNLDDVPAIIQDNIQVFKYDTNLLGGDKLHNHLMDVSKKMQIGQNPVILEELSTEFDPTLCLGLVPKYQSEKSDAYTHIIKHVAEKDFGFHAMHLGEVTGTGSVLEKCWDYINRACIIVADLTRHDSQVCYWAGVTYGLEKEMVTLAKSGEEIPFDLRGVHRVNYSMAFGKGSEARENLKNAMKLSLQRKTEPKYAKSHVSGGNVGSKGSESETEIQEKESTMPKKKQKQSVDVVILTVLEEEYQAVCLQLKNLQPLPGTKAKPNLYAWQTGNVFSANYDDTYQVVVGMTGRAGNPQSTMATIEAVNLWDPRYVFFSGIAGGLLDFKKAARNPDFKPDIQLGDVVIADIIHGYEYGKVETDFLPRDDWTYHTDLGLLTKAIANKSNPDWRERIKLRHPTGRKPNVINGQVVSGDKVVDNPSNAFFSVVYRKWPKARAVEMEGAGVGAAINQARDRGKVVGFLMIRGISDIPRSPESVELFKKWEGERGVKERDKWKPYAADVAASFIVGLIANGLPVPPKEGD